MVKISLKTAIVTIAIVSVVGVVVGRQNSNNNLDIRTGKPKMIIFLNQICIV